MVKMVKTKKYHLHKFVYRWKFVFETNKEVFVNTFYKCVQALFIKNNLSL